MKCSVFFILVLLTNITLLNGQIVLNPLTYQELLDIELNGKSIADIKATNGQEAAMRSLFGNFVKAYHEDAGEWPYSAYDHGGISVLFEDYDYDNEYVLQGFEVESSMAVITIKGIDLRLGDHVGKLGRNILLNNDITGNKSILYSVKTDTGHFFDEFIAIDFDQQTKTITKIEYIAPT